ncbi:MAG: hypothetical protein QM686_23190 [Herbaspirillum sp.]
MTLTTQRWDLTWKKLGLVCPDTHLFDSVLSHYREPHRHYHTLQHLHECFAKWEELRTESSHPGEVELALWFHDVIYDVKRHDNEEKSADWARRCLLDAGASEEIAQRVHALVMATRHHQPSVEDDASLLVDVDLSILAAPPDRFEEYERQIRAEYDYVPLALFMQERKKILQGFLNRPRIYRTKTFFELYEATARKNLERAIEASA